MQGVLPLRSAVQSMSDCMRAVGRGQAYVLDRQPADLTLGVGAVEGVAAGEHDKQHHPAAPDVCHLAVVPGLTRDVEQHLWSHVGERANLQPAATGRGV